MAIFESEDCLIVEVGANSHKATEAPEQVERYQKLKRVIEKYDERDSLNWYIEHSKEGPKGMDAADILQEVILSLIGWEEFWAWLVVSESNPPGNDAMARAVTLLIESEEEA